MDDPNSASGHPQHRRGDSFECCTERYEIIVYCFLRPICLIVRENIVALHYYMGESLQDVLCVYR